MKTIYWNPFTRNIIHFLETDKTKSYSYHSIHAANNKYTPRKRKGKKTKPKQQRERKAITGEISKQQQEKQGGRSFRARLPINTAASASGHARALHPYSSLRPAPPRPDPTPAASVPTHGASFSPLFSPRDRFRAVLCCWTTDLVPWSMLLTAGSVPSCVWSGSLWYSVPWFGSNLDAWRNSANGSR
jgi:hypothetical protein